MDVIGHNYDHRQVNEAVVEPCGHRSGQYPSDVVLRREGGWPGDGVMGAKAGGSELLVLFLIMAVSCCDVTSSLN